MFKKKKQLFFPLLIFIASLFFHGCAESDDQDTTLSINIEDFWIGQSDSFVSPGFMNISLSLSQRGSGITGTLNCSDGNMTCGHSEGTISGTLIGKNLTLTLSFPDGHSCQMDNGTVSGLIITGDVWCTDPAGDDSGSWEIHTLGSCTGVLISGLCLKLEYIFPEYLGTPTLDVDAFLTDCDGDGIPDETLGDHLARIKFSLSVVPDFDPSSVPNFLTLNSYTIRFIPSLSNAGVSPNLTEYSVGIFGGFNLDTGNSTDFLFKLVPLSTKSEYNLNGGELIPQSYTAIYTFSWLTPSGGKVTIQGSTYFNIGEFEYCP